MSLRMLTFAATSLLPLSAQAQWPSPTIVTDPNAVVLDRTLAEWTTVWHRWAFATPANAIPSGCAPGQCSNAFYDPTGAYAEAYNPGPIFFWTGSGLQGTSATSCGTTPLRTVNVPVGKPILFGIRVMEDSEGPNGIYPPLIVPSIPNFVPPHTYAEEVETVVNASSWTNVTMTVDCRPVENLQESKVTEFSAGIVAQGSYGQIDFLCSSCGAPYNAPLPAGLELFPSGTAGYWVIIEGLTPGKHAISATSTWINSYFGCPGPSGCPTAHTESVCVSNNPPCD